MKLHLVGCSHHSSSVDIRERLAFTPDQTVAALRALHGAFPESEAVLLSTCNRVELYAASQDVTGFPSHAATHPLPRRIPRTWTTAMCRATCSSTPTWKPRSTCSR